MTRLSFWGECGRGRSTLRKEQETFLLFVLPLALEVQEEVLLSWASEVEGSMNIKIILLLSQDTPEEHAPEDLFRVMLTCNVLGFSNATSLPIE